LRGVRRLAESEANRMGMITIRRHEDVLEVRNRMSHGLMNEKALSVKKYSGMLKLKEEPMVYQKRVRQEWE